MSKLIDITDKLNFEEKPSVRVKNVDLAINNDAVSMLKVAALFAVSYTHLTLPTTSRV